MASQSNEYGRSVTDDRHLFAALSSILHSAFCKLHPLPLVTMGKCWQLELLITRATAGGPSLGLPFRPSIYIFIIYVAFWNYPEISNWGHTNPAFEKWALEMQRYCTCAHPDYLSIFSNDIKMLCFAKEVLKNLVESKH